MRNNRILLYLLVSACWLCLPRVAAAGSIGDTLRAECPKQAQQYDSTINEYAIRMRDYVEAYGCGVITAYGVFAETDIDRIAQWEDSEDAFEDVNSVFFMADQYHLDVANNPLLFDALLSLIGSGSSVMNDRLDRLLSNLSRRERNHINKAPEQILYLIWALQMNENSKSKAMIRQANRLQSDFPPSYLPAALILNGQIGIAYPDIKPLQRYQLVKDVVHSFSADLIKKIALNHLALSNFINLLPPQLGDLPYIQGLTDQELIHVQSDYVQVMKVVLEQFNHLTGNIGASMDASSVLAPYILDALKDAPAMAISTYLKAQISSPTFQTFVQQYGSCRDDEFATITGSFFAFLNPQKKVHGSYEALPYLQHNLARIANWYRIDPNMRAWIKDTQNDPTSMIQNLARLPFLYREIPSRSRTYLSKLIQELPGTKNENASFILALGQYSDYFQWVGTANDADSMVISNEDVGDKSAPKYIYMLLTPYPSQNDPSIFNRFQVKKSDVGMVSLIHRYTVDDFSTHTFTKKEKCEALAGNIDNAITIAAIVAVPLTGGASILVIGSRLAAKQVMKKGLKYSAKVLYRYARKNFSRTIRRSASRLTGKEGKQAFKRELKELAGHAPKRGRPSMYAENQSKMRNIIVSAEKESDSRQSQLLITSMLGVATAIYCAKFADHTSKTWLKSICNVDAEQESTDICQNIQQGGI